MPGESVWQVFGPSSTTPSTRFLFLLMGAEILALGLAGFVQPAVLAAVSLAIVSRFVSIALPVSIWRCLVRTVRMVSGLSWTGLRGAVSIALVLTIPPGLAPSAGCALSLTTTVDNALPSSYKHVLIWIWELRNEHHAGRGVQRRPEKP